MMGDSDGDMPESRLTDDPLVQAWLDPEVRLYDSPGDVGLLQSYIIAPDPDVRELLALRLQQKKASRVIADDPFYRHYPPKGTVLSSETALCLGMMPTGDGVPLPLSRLSSGVAFEGPTGMAKTTLTQWLIYQLACQ